LDAWLFGRWLAPPTRAFDGGRSDARNRKLDPALGQRTAAATVPLGGLSRAERRRLEREQQRRQRNT
jgi:hypothetical protein